MTTTTYVIAGEYREYYAFLDRIGMPRKNTKYTFISDPLRLYGLRDVNVLCVGTYWNSPVYENQYIKLRKYVNRISFVDEGGVFV